MKKTVKLSWVLLSVFYTLYLWVISATSSFGKLGIPEMFPRFADLRLITTASECFQQGNWWVTGESCDPWGRPFNYPSLWVKLFSFFGLGNSQTVVLGNIEIVILSASLSYWIIRSRALLKSKNQIRAFPFFVLGVLFSPPILLLAERGNTDILIFAGITCASELLRRSNFFVTTTLISFLGALKLYPFAGILVFLLAKKSKFQVFYLILVFSFTLLLTFSELNYILRWSQNGWNSISYGMSMIPLLALQIYPTKTIKIVSIAIGFIILVIVASIFHLLFKSFPIRVSSFPSPINIQNSGSILSSSIFLASYVSGTSYDYRLILATPVLLNLFISSNSAKSLRFSFAAMFLLMYLGHLTDLFGNYGIILNIVGDVSITLLAAWILQQLTTACIITFNSRRGLID